MDTTSGYGHECSILKFANWNVTEITYQMEQLNQGIRKDKGKGHPRTGHEGPEGVQMYTSTLPSTRR